VTGRRLFLVALVSESVLAVMALLLARLFLGSFFPWPFSLDGTDAAIGALAAMPPALVVLSLWSPMLARFATIRRARDHMLARMKPVLARPLANCRWPEAAGISVCAGLGEEIFFRGLLQSTLGTIPSALVFGVLHALTLFYFLLATAIGLYFSLLLATSGNLLVPVVAHAVYDLFALYLLRQKLHVDNL
jgi:membrane protease YdiL (CAAX protease family)